MNKLIEVFVPKMGNGTRYLWERNDRLWHGFMDRSHPFAKYQRLRTFHRRATKEAPGSSYINSEATLSIQEIEILYKK